MLEAGIRIVVFDPLMHLPMSANLPRVRHITLTLGLVNL